MYSLTFCARRSLEFQKWRNLRVSVQNAFALFNSFSFASASDLSLRDGRKGNNFTVSYLVNSLGLATKLAESISRKVSFEEKGNPDSVLKLLRSHRFTDSQVSTIITTYPRLLILDAEKSLGPRLQFLQTRGASSSELIQIVSTVPKILGKRGHKTISVYYDFIKDTLDHKSSEKSTQGNLENKIRNLSVLRELGLPQKLLFSLLVSDCGLVHGKEKFEDSLKKVVEMGFNPTTANFVLAMRVVHGSRDKTIEEKMDVYERLGLAVGDVWEMFKKAPSSLGISKEKIENSIETFLGLGFTRDEFAMMVMRYPQCIVYSAEMVKKKNEFFVKKMNWSLKAVVSNPSGFGYSLKKRITPRCNVIKALMSKGLLRSKPPPMSSVLAITDKDFLNKYVMMHNDKQLVHGLMAIFTGDRVSLTDKKAHLEQ
ncbi:Transcription termination factor MTEF1 [Cardamine amara subsp. amara]|uniref:Transcription termination factor MTEF1 n=1 Tax=Cardamine amara subsp. amara TaxID=228776 RepID=A0ABD1B2T5_CARAN